MTVVLVTGGFDPLHEGHISYFNQAKLLGDILVVGINSDNWLIRKKGKFFQNYHTRSTIIKNLKSVDEIISFNDKDNSAIDAIKKVLKMYDSNVVFANGGDRTISNIPEQNYDYGEDNKRLSFVFGVGGEDKLNSSSWILNKWNS